MFEILHFRCDFEDKEVHACLLADLILLMLSCFACQSVLQSTTSLPISYPFYYLYTALCYCFLGSSSAAESLCISSYPRICIKLSFQVSFVYFLSLCCPQSTYLSTRFFRVLFTSIPNAISSTSLFHISPFLLDYQHQYEWKISCLSTCRVKNFHMTHFNNCLSSKSWS